MIYFIIGIIGFGILFWLWEESFGGVILGMLVGLLVGLIAFIVVGGIVGACLPTTTKLIEEKPLCALTDSTSTEGSKFLFSGYIDEELICRYIVETERGKHIEEINSNAVYINEGDYTPHVKKYEQVFVKDWYYWIGEPIFYDTIHYEFFVPKDTVTSKYEIDLN